MNRKKRAVRRIIAVALVIVSVLLAMLLRFRLVPVIRELAKTRVSNEASTAINRAVNRQITSGSIDYDRIVLLEKSVDGSIAAIKTNMAEANRLKAEILNEIDDEIMELSVSEIGIPLGSVFLPELLSGKGPVIPVRILSVKTSDAAFHSQFYAAGINQTLHQILINVKVTVTVLTPLGTQTVSADSEVIVAETVIVGSVPQTYMNMDGIADQTKERS